MAPLDVMASSPMMASGGRAEASSAIIRSTDIGLRSQRSLTRFRYDSRACSFSLASSAALVRAASRAMPGIPRSRASASSMRPALGSATIATSVGYTFSTSR